jgi:hypothetical protein
MTQTRRREPTWPARFLEALAGCGCVRQAASEAGIGYATAYRRARKSAEFARQWDEALDAAEAAKAASLAPQAPREITGRPAPNWPRRFIEALMETSNVAASAARVNVALSKVYKRKHADPRFAAAWLAALHEGYDQLEMELLGYLRDPGSRPKMDVANAIRLLAAHRQVIERRRALTEEEREDEQTILESLDRYLADMRERRRANAAILIEAEPANAE